MLAISWTLALSLVLPLHALAQTTAADSGFQFRVNGPLVVGRGVSEGVAVVIKGDVRVEGRVGALVVINGNAKLIGGRVSDLTVVRGRAELSDGAIVENEVHLLDAELAIADSARVVGTVERGAGRRLARDLIGLAAVIGLGILVALVVGGIVAAAIAPHLLRSTGRLITSEPGSTALAALTLWVVFPFAAVLLAATIIGAPAGVGFFVFVLPVTWFVGLIVAGAWIGDELLGRLRGRIEATRPFLATAVGMVALLILGRLPVLGMLVFVATAMGAGAVALACWRSMTASRSAPA
jgi:acetyltransferase-like isoleucine patch superfamily enzyme